VAIPFAASHFYGFLGTGVAFFPKESRQLKSQIPSTKSQTTTIVQMSKTKIKIYEFGYFEIWLEIVLWDLQPLLSLRPRVPSQ
jgi:hypothetical protein